MSTKCYFSSDNLDVMIKLHHATVLDPLLDLDECRSLFRILKSRGHNAKYEYS